MRRFGVTVMVVLAAMMVVGASGASAFSGGGKKPSEAPLVAWGQHYEASVGNKLAEANYVGTSCCNEGDQVAIWRLGPLSVHDQVVVNWHELPYAHESGYPVKLTFAENIDDFNWGTTWAHGSYKEVSGSGSGRTEFTVQNTSSADYLEFWSRAGSTESKYFETFPYDFSVEAPRHFLSVSLGAVQRVAPTGVLHATATLATGAPAPDGLPFTLTGTWSGGGIFTATAASVGGQISFPLAMPETAWKHSVEFVATSAATAEWQSAISPKLTVEVTKPKPPAPAVEPQLCTKATNRAHVLARQYHRQLRHATAARGRHRRRLMHEAHATERRWDAAKAARKAAC